MEAANALWIVPMAMEPAFESACTDPSGQDDSGRQDSRYGMVWDVNLKIHRQKGMGGSAAAPASHSCSWPRQL